MNSMSVLFMNCWHSYFRIIDFKICVNGECLERFMHWVPAMRCWESWLGPGPNLAIYGGEGTNIKNYYADCEYRLVSTSSGSACVKLKPGVLCSICPLFEQVWVSYGLLWVIWSIPYCDFVRRFFLAKFLAEIPRGLDYIFQVSIKF